VILHVRSMIKRMGKEAIHGAFLSPVLTAARKCTACGECSERCPCELPIPELIRENLDWVDSGMG
jgi:L-lactate utilization protein LutB